MNKTFIIKQDMKFLEFLNAVFYQMSGMKLIRTLFLISFILSLGSILLDLTTISAQQRNWYHIIFDFLLPPIFLLAFFVVFTTIGAVLLMLLRSNHFKNVTYSFNNWGMEKNGKGIEFTRPWRKFLKFRESRHFIFLYITENDAHIIQKRMFESKDELQNFVQLMLQHLNK